MVDALKSCKKSIKYLGGGGGRETTSKSMKFV